VPLGHKCPLVILLDCVSKKYCVLLPPICSDISCFSWPYKSGPSIALFYVPVKMLHQFIITVPHISADHLVQRPPYFPLPSVSPTIKSFVMESDLYNFFSKIFQFAYCYQHNK
jgi:hypothetical protein